MISSNHSNDSGASEDMDAVMETVALFMRNVRCKVEKHNIIFRNIEQINQFVTLAERYDCDMDLGEGTLIIDAKSLMAIIAVGVNKKMKLTVHGEIDEDFRLHIAQLR